MLDGVKSKVFGFMIVGVVLTYVTLNKFVFVRDYSDIPRDNVATVALFQFLIVVILLGLAVSLSAVLVSRGLDKLYEKDAERERQLLS